MNSIAINGQARTELGKKGAKAVRKEGKIPCVLYGGEKVIHFSTTANDVKDLVYSSSFKLAEINLDGTSYKSIIREIQFHPVTDAIVHIDFIQLVDGKKINAELPLRFEGTAPGEKLGGKLQQKLRRVKIKTTPEHLVDVLTLNISELELGQSVRVRDIEVNEHTEIMSAMGIPVATIEVPRALRSAEAEEEEAAAAEAAAEGDGEAAAEGDGE